jgi:hypothetical protein
MSCLECTDCLSVGTFDICCDSIVLAQADPSTTYKVVITDVSLNSKTTYELTTGVSGDITLSPNEGVYSPNRTYEVRIYHEDACDFNDPHAMTNDLHPDAEFCFSFQFERLS